nr:hypothetical protein GCM10020093_001100 [Planobispora longispora]
MDGKFKYGGNVDEAHRRHVAGRLAERGAPATPPPGDTSCAAWADEPRGPVNVAGESADAC